MLDNWCGVSDCGLMQLLMYGILLINCTTTFTFCNHVICQSFLRLYIGANKRKNKSFDLNYFTILGGSLKKIAKNMIPNVPTNKKV